MSCPYHSHKRNVLFVNSMRLCLLYYLLVVPLASLLGSLSAWFRIKYPHLVVGAIATSAPVQAELNFVEYLEVVRDSLSTTPQGAECVSAIKMANTQLTALLQKKESWPVVEKMFM